MTNLATCLQQFALADGHTVAERDLVRDDIYAIRAAVSNWIADTAINVVVTTGGTGFTGRDSTPEALTALFDKQIEGFGEIFRQLVLRGNRHFNHPISRGRRIGKRHFDL